MARRKADALAEPDALAIVYRNPAELVADKQNTRQHSPEQIAAIRRSIDEFGFTNPILLRDDGSTIGAGHARVLAALTEPVVPSVPTIVVPGLTKTQWQAYVIADNRLAEVGASWDLALLKQELLDLEAEGFAISLTGFNDADLAKLLEDNSQPDDIWAGMPEFSHQDKRAFRSVAVHFVDQAAVDKFVELLDVKDRMSERAKYLWYPEMIVEHFADKEYIAEAT
jgi:ParB-like chromosome segregation protein Spo0J